MSATLNSTSTELTAAELFGAEEKPALEAMATGETKNENSEAQSDADESAKETKDENDSRGDDGEESEGEKDSEDESDESDDDEPKGEKQKGVGKRISKLVKQKQSLKQEIEYWKSQAMSAKPEKGQGESHKAGESKQDARPKAEDFDSYEDYQIALSEYGTRKALAPALEKIDKAMSGKSAEAEADKATKAFEKRNKDFAKEHSDYQDTLKSLIALEIKVDPSVDRAIAESDLGPALLYELGKNPDLAEEIADMPPHRQLKEIGKLELKIEQRLEAKKNAIPKTTKAPAPPTPVGSKSEGKKSVDDQNLSALDFFKLRNEEEKRIRNNYF